MIPAYSEDRASVCFATVRPRLVAIRAGKREIVDVGRVMGLVAARAMGDSGWVCCEEEYDSVRIGSGDHAAIEASFSRNWSTLTASASSIRFPYLLSAVRGPPSLMNWSLPSLSSLPLNDQSTEDGEMGPLTAPVGICAGVVCNAPSVELLARAFAPSFSVCHASVNAVLFPRNSSIASSNIRTTAGVSRNRSVNVWSEMSACRSLDGRYLICASNASTERRTNAELRSEFCHSVSNSFRTLSKPPSFFQLHACKSVKRRVSKEGHNSAYSGPTHRSTIALGFIPSATSTSSPISFNFCAALLDGVRDWARGPLSV